MRKTLYYISILLLVLSACEPMEKIYDEREKDDSGYTGSTTLTLTTDDYAEIADIAMSKATTPEDSSLAAFIDANEHFNDSIKAAEYIPGFLAQRFPAMKFLSTAMVTYNYNGEMPEDLTMYTEALEYELLAEDYESFDSVLNITKFYSPSYSPEVYVPQVLDNVVALPEDGDMILVEYKYASADAEIDFGSLGDAPIYEENFTLEADGLGSFTAFNVLGEQEWGWASYGNGCAVMTGFVNPDSYDNEDWLVSPEYDLAGLDEVALYFKHAVNYNDEEWDNVTVYISTDYDGSSSPANQGTWTELTVPGIPFDESWTFVSSGRIDLAAYAGEKVYVAFKYLSTTVTAGTWEIGQVQISVPNLTIVGKTPENYKNYYVFDENDGWAKANEVYHVNSVDYDAMGSPGNYNNFSSSDKPQDYLPNLLKSKYPLAGQDMEVVVVYNYFNSINFVTTTLADKYTFNEGEWESAYNFVEAKTDQFVVTDKNEWVFDPTISFKLVADDFQVIVDWVAAQDNLAGKPGSEYVNSFGTGEDYHGADAYFQNFDIRSTSYESSVFESWEDAVEAAIITAYLPIKYPDAKTQVDGVDQMFVVNFDTYSGADGNYTMKFQVTKSGPNPEFELVEGPY
jgi:hypothetical protein